MKTIFTFFASLLIISTIGCPKKQSLLYVLRAPNAQVTINKETAAQELILQDTQDKAIWFAERPIRKAGSIGMDAFLKIWDKERDNFEKDPPNAALVINSNEPVVVELALSHWNESEVVFKISPLDKANSKVEPARGTATLFIDAFPTAVNSQITD